MDLGIRGREAIVCAACSGFIFGHNLLLDGGTCKSSTA
jgi:hypothetical protein